MRLYLVRHGAANPPRVDPACGLSEAGQAEVGRLAAFIKPLGLQPAEVRHSGKERAAQTVRLLLPSLAGSPEVVEHPGLQPNDPPMAIAAEVEAQGGDLMLVGHLPFMGLLSAYLLAGSGPAQLMLFHTGTLACLEKQGSGAWQLEWMIHPRILPVPKDRERW